MDLLLTGRLDAAEQAAWVSALAAALPEHRLLLRNSAGALVDSHGGEPADAAAVQVAIVANPAPGSLHGLPALRLIQSLWAGVERLLADPSLPAGVPIARMVDPAMNQAMAETAAWATLSLHRDHFTYARQQRAGLWQAQAQRRADEVPVLLLGWGQMAQASARHLRALGYPVRAWRRQAPAGAQAAAHAAAAATARHPAVGDDKPIAAAPGVHVPGVYVPDVEVLSGAAALHAALPATQVLINLLPLTPTTRGILNADLLAALPRGAGVVNLARGAHAVDADLLAALDSGHIGHAVLDVFGTEPLPAAHAYWQHPAVTVLPHAAAATDPRSAAAVVARNVQALVRGEPLAHRVDRQRGY